MNTEEFNKVVKEQIQRSMDVLIEKATEYAMDSDRLHNFNIAADLQGLTPRQALSGMMAKHTVSVYDMAQSTDIFPDHYINEKITDHINYLLLLRAILTEEKSILASARPAYDASDF